MNSLIIIDSQNKRVEIKSDHQLTVPEILTELSQGEYALLTAGQDFMSRIGMHVLPKDR